MLTTTEYDIDIMFDTITKCMNMADLVIYFTEMHWTSESTMEIISSHVKTHEWFLYHKNTKVGRSTIRTHSNS
jgi:hypothetical protein